MSIAWEDSMWGEGSDGFGSSRSEHDSRFSECSACLDEVIDDDDFTARGIPFFNSNLALIALSSYLGANNPIVSGKCLMEALTRTIVWKGYHRIFWQLKERESRMELGIHVE